MQGKEIGKKVKYQCLWFCMFNNHYLFYIHFREILAPLSYRISPTVLCNTICFIDGRLSHLKKGSFLSSDIQKYLRMQQRGGALPQQLVQVRTQTFQRYALLFFSLTKINSTVFLNRWFSSKHWNVSFVKVKC